MQIASAFFNELESALRRHERSKRLPTFRLDQHHISMGWDNRHVRVTGDREGLNIVKSQAWIDEKDDSIDVVERYVFADPRTTIENVIDSMIDILHFYKGSWQR